MNRRDFIKRGAAATTAAALPALTATGQKPSDNRPNVLYVFSDQHRALSLPGEPLTSRWRRRSTDSAVRTCRWTRAFRITHCACRIGAS